MFIDEQRERFGVEPICLTLGVSASAYYQRATGERSARRVEDDRLLELIHELHRRNYFAYGSWRMWKALLRAGEQVGRGRVERLMRCNGIQGYGVLASIGTVGDAYDNAAAESFVDSFKTELIRDRV
jgi:putative transposase